MRTLSAWQLPLFGRPGWVFPGAALDLDFVHARGFAARRQRSLASLLATTRASTGYADSEGGVWSPFAHNVPRITDKGLLVEEARTNSVRNNSMQGAVAGSPGTLPTNWLGLLNGLTQTVVGVGTENGVDYIDIRFSGTTNGAGNTSVLFDTTTGIPASEDDVWTQSAFLSIVGGDLTNISSVQLNTTSRTAAGAFIANHTTDITSSLTGALTRVAGTSTLSDGGTVGKVLPIIYFGVSGAVAVDITLRIGWPQLELGSFVTSPIRTTTVAATRAGDVVRLASPSVIGAAGGTGTLFVEAMIPTDPTAHGITGVLMGWSDVASFSGNNHQYIQMVATSALIASANVYAGATNFSQNTGVAATANVPFKAAQGVSLNDANEAVNGTLGAGDTSVTPAVGPAAAISLGNSSWGQGNQLNGYIRRASYFPTRLSNAQLQALTS